MSRNLPTSRRRKAFKAKRRARQRSVSRRKYACERETMPSTQAFPTIGTLGWEWRTAADWRKDVSQDSTGIVTCFYFPLQIRASSLEHFFLHLDPRPHALLGFLLSHDGSFFAPLRGSSSSLHPGRVDPECRPGTSVFPLLSCTELQRSPESRRLTMGQSHPQGQTVKRGLLGWGQRGVTS